MTKVRMKYDVFEVDIETEYTAEISSLIAIAKTEIKEMVEDFITHKQRITAIESADEGESSQMPEGAKIQTDNHKPIMPAEGVAGMFQ